MGQNSDIPRAQIANSGIAHRPRRPAMDPTLLLSLTGIIVAFVALLAAIFQAIASVSQLLAGRSRCGRRVTGAFDLREGIWLSLVTFTPNIRYRMPILTFSKLRERPSETPSFTRGLAQNYLSEKNCYVDHKAVRISGSLDPTVHVDPNLILWPRTLLTAVLHFITLPLGLVWMSFWWGMCFPCNVYAVVRWVLFGKKPGADPTPGCGGDSCAPHSCLLCSHMLCIWSLSWRKCVRYRDLELGKMDLVTSGLEAACWVQFLMTRQRLWWGLVSIRWEWRLASSIPPDVSGATLETTVADLQLLAAMSGMKCLEGPVMAQSLCGEQITVTHHTILGRLAHYRSTRDSTSNFVEMERREKDELMGCFIWAMRMHQQDPTGYLGDTPAFVLYGPQNQELEGWRVDGIFRYLSRLRTVFDAQLSFSCGHGAQILSLPSFQAELTKVRTEGGILWEERDVLVNREPFGQGLNNCSCVRCSEYTGLRGMDTGCTLPALEVRDLAVKEKTPSIGPRLLEDYMEDYFRPVKVETHVYCHAASCVVDECACGPVARLRQSSPTTPSVGELLAVAAINNEWLKSTSPVDRTAAVELLLAGANSPTSSQGSTSKSAYSIANSAANPTKCKEVTANVKMVIAYTEYVLADLRPRIGSADVWDSDIITLSDFSQVALG